MRRREFIGALCGASAAWPTLAQAQPAARLPTIGFLGTATLSTMGPRVAAFEQRLRELGWSKQERCDRVPLGGRARASVSSEIAAEFVRLKSRRSLSLQEHRSSSPSKRLTDVAFRSFS